jgi:hypothetical protein
LNCRDSGLITADRSIGDEGDVPDVKLIVRCVPYVGRTVSTCKTEVEFGMRFAEKKDVLRDDVDSKNYF